MRRALFLLTLVAAMVFACGGVVLAQQDSTTPNSEQRTTPDSSRPAAEGDYVAGEVLVQFKENTAKSKKDAVIKEKGDQVKETISGLDVEVVAVPEGKEKAKVREYQADSNVKYAELNGYYYESQMNDPMLKDQWGFNNTGLNSGTSGADIRAFKSWAVGHTPSREIPIAVLDGGINRNHPDLQLPDGSASRVTVSKDFITGSQDAYDGSGHGTHVAGTIAATTNNTKGGAGTCGDWDKCVLVNGKVLNDSGSGTDVSVANGILWASGCDVEEGQPCNDAPRAKVINMSLGGGGTTTLKNAVEKAWANGVVLVAAAGNSGAQSPSAPAQYEKVIAVAATDNTDKKASYSNYGSGTLASGADWNVDVAAPGSNILSTTKDGSYGYKSGTSMATPHVSGTVGLVWFKMLNDALTADPNAVPNTTNQQVRDQVENNADQIAGTGAYWSKGRINACRALGGTDCQGYSFTPTSDKIAPIVAYHTPGTNATGVARTTSVTATFSEEMKASTITTTTFKLLDNSTGARVSATVSCDSPCKRATLTPSQSLAANKKYKAVVTTGVQDAAIPSNAMTQNRVWYFTTGS